MNAESWVAVVVAVVGLAGGGGGFVAWYREHNRSDAGNRDAIGDAVDRGWDRAAEKYEADLDRLRVELDAERETRKAEFESLREVLMRHHRAIYRLVKLVPPESMPAALDILEELAIIPYDFDDEGPSPNGATP